MIEHRCAWRNCNNTGYLFCDAHYPEVFEHVSKDARFMVERMRLEQRWASFIYFMPTTDGHVKIGTSESPRRRLDEWSLSEPTFRTFDAVIVRGSGEVELEIHDMFRDLVSAEREVFTDHPDIWELAERLRVAGRDLLALEWAVRGAATRRQITAPP